MRLLVAVLTGAVLAAEPAVPTARYPTWPGLFDDIDGAPWAEAEARFADSVRREQHILGLETLDWHAIQHARESGRWQQQTQQALFEQAVAMGDPYLSVATLEAARSVGVPGLEGAEARVPVRVFDAGRPIYWWLAIFGPLVGAVLLDSLAIARDMRIRRGRRRGARLRNPYVTGRPVRDPALVFGRQRLIEDLLAHIDDRRCCWITGERRIGKTTVLLQLADLARQRGAVPVFVDIEGARGDVARHAIRKALLDAGAPKGPSLEAMGRHLAASGPLVLLVDEIDALNGADAPTREAIRRLAVDPDAPGVLIGSGVGLDLDRDAEARRWAERLDHLEVAPLSEDACRALLLEPTANVLSWDEDAVRAVLASSEGRPMRVQLFALKAVERAERQATRRVRAADIDAVREAVETAWRAVQQREDISGEVLIDIDAATLELGYRRLELEALRRALGSQ